MMKVLLVVIDGVFCPAVRTGRLATMQALADAGTMHEALRADLLPLAVA